MSEKTEKQGSFVDPKDYADETEVEAPSETIPQPEDPNVPLFVKLDKIIEAIQDNTKAQNAVAHQLCRLADNKGVPTGTKTPSFLQPKVEELPAKAPTEPVKKSPQPPKEASKEVDEVMNMFPSSLRSKLTFLKQETNVKIGIREYLGSENFAKIAGVVRNNGGEYISAGKESHFLVPFAKQKTETEAKQTPTPAPTPQPQQEGLTVETLKQLFPNDLEDMLTFEDKGSWIRVAPRQYLGSDNFAKIASIIRDQGGEYVSAGKESHFKVNKK